MKEWRCPDTLAELRYERERRASVWFLLGALLGGCVSIALAMRRA